MAAFDEISAVANSGLIALFMRSSAFELEIFVQKCYRLRKQQELRVKRKEGKMLHGALASLFSDLDEINDRSGYEEALHKQLISLAEFIHNLNGLSLENLTAPVTAFDWDGTKIRKSFAGVQAGRIGLDAIGSAARSSAAGGASAEFSVQSLRTHVNSLRVGVGGGGGSKGPNDTRRLSCQRPDCENKRQ